MFVCSLQIFFTLHLLIFTFISTNTPYKTSLVMYDR